MRVIRLALTLFSLLLSVEAWAGDYHQNDSTHVVTVNVNDSSGNFVSGETVRLTMWRPRDNSFFDFSDNTFKQVSSVTTLHRTLSQNSTMELYFTTISIDNGALISGDIICTVSNESATYGFTASEGIYFDRLEKVVKINR